MAALTTELTTELKTLWWFVEGQAAGMARPGFNRCPWFELGLEEGVLQTWIGERSHLARAAFDDDLGPYLDAYGPKVAPFFDLTAEQVKQRLDRLLDPDELVAALERMKARAGVLASIWKEPGGDVAYQLDRGQLQRELAELRRREISVVISLIAPPPDPALAAAGFEVHHLPVEDLTPPSLERVAAFSDLLFSALDDGKKVVTHCLAGVGRTTTIYLAASLLRGVPWDELVARVKICNPYYQFKGRQVSFLEQLAVDVLSSPR
jgi:Polymorphic toxin system, DSP-PTPase phosphatase